jgi:hypothetical protein
MSDDVDALWLEVAARIRSAFPPRRLGVLSGEAGATPLTRRKAKRGAWSSAEAVHPSGTFALAHFAAHCD